MAGSEDPSFGGMGTADAITTAAQAIAGIKADMAAIEASAKNTAKELKKAGQVSVSSSGSPSAQENGNTGYSKDQGMSLGAITQAVGGTGVMVAGGVAALGGMAGMTSAGFGTAALATGAFRDLRVTADQGLAYERARFNYALGTGGQFAQFRSGLEQSMNSFNVQDREVYAQQFGQLSQLYGLQAAGTTVGSRNFGALMTSMQYAGMDQAGATQMYNQLYGANSYYNLMAMGVQTRDVQGNPMATYQIANQVYDFIGGGRNISSEELQRAMQPGSGLRVSLEQAVGVEGANLILSDLQRRVAGGGEALTEEAGELLGTEDTQGMEARARLEQAGVGVLGEYTNDATKGIQLMTDEITKATEYLRDLEGPLRDLAGAATSAFSALDTFAADLPKAAGTVQGAFSGLASLLGAFVLDLLIYRKLLGLGKGGGGTTPGAGTTSRAGTTPKGPVANTGVRAPKTGPSSSVSPGSSVNLKGVKGLAWISAALEGWDIYAGEGGIQEEGFWRGLFRGPVSLVENVQQYGLWEGMQRSMDTPYARETYGEGRSKGDWFVEKDQTAKIHYGEMVVPARIAQAVRDELQMGQVSPIGGDRRNNGPTQVNINLTLQHATDQEAMRFANRVKKILDTDSELLAAGSGRF